MRKLFLLLLVSLLTIIGGSLVFANESFANEGVTVERHALVIGNSDYADQPLVNPENDAIDMARQLEVLGYKVHAGGPMLDLDRLGMERAVRAFAAQLPENANALVYYAGHGMAVGKDNYLIPTKHNLEAEEQLPDRAVSLRSIIRVLKNANTDGLNAVLLDACRDNPLQNSYRSTSAGLTRLEDIPRGVFVGYAADAGQVAEDGDGRNGTYTGELLNVMREKPNVIIELAHKEVASRVYTKTGGKQFPVSENKVFGDWCFGNCEDRQFLSTAPPAQQVQEPVVQKTKKKRWWIAGAAGVALVVVGALAAGGGSDSASNFTLEVIPPDVGN